ncbi:MAG: UDP-2,4-diacetamido-2,4,6-trideoxy-beta-L-altropyranose hydrolase [Deltaproteobacteria bacterium]
MVLCTNGGEGIGLGHVRRCLSLARALATRGAECVFLVNEDPKIVPLIADAGFPVRVAGKRLSGSAGIVSEAGRFDRIVVDSYLLTTADFTALRSAGRLVVLDDLADRDIPADLVVNPSPNAGALVYRSLPSTRFLLGPSYAVLQPEFAEPGRREVGGSVRRVLITLGGGDPGGLTADVVRWVRSALPETPLDVVVGPLAEPPAIAPESGVSIHRSPDSMRTLMVRADLAVAAGGQTTFELAATGTPSVVVAVADNQVPQSRAWDSEGALWYASPVWEQGLGERVSAMVRSLADDPAARARMSERGRALVDGRGATRVAAAVLEG